MQLLPSLDALPSWAAARLIGHHGFFSTAAWWRTVWEAGIPQGATPLLALHGNEGGGVLLPLLRDAAGRLSALTNPYTCLYPLAATANADLTAAGRALARLPGAAPTLRLDALDPADAGLIPLLRGTRAAGRLALRFDHFGNWHEEIAGRGWDAYLSARPGALRETVRRRLRAIERDRSLSFACLTTNADAAHGVAEYESVYARSWKEPEPFPDFNAALIRHAAAAGALRLGVLRRDATPIAVQLWVVHEATAAVLKLAHDEAEKPISPGTALTAWMLRRLIDQERVKAVDFGRGDDPYKRMWTTSRRQRFGIVLAAPWYPTGLAMALRHTLGRLIARRSASVTPA